MINLAVNTAPAVGQALTGSCQDICRQRDDQVRFPCVYVIGIWRIISPVPKLILTYQQDTVKWIVFHRISVKIHMVSTKNTAVVIVCMSILI